MATRLWNGDADPQVAEVNTFTAAGTWTATSAVTTQLTDEGGSVTTKTTTASTTASGTIALHLSDLKAITTAPFNAVTWASGTSATKIKGTAKTAGVPFHSAATETTATGAGTYTVVTTTSNVGKHDFNTATNWSGGAVPVTGDAAFIAGNGVDILYGLPQATRTAIDLNEFRVAPTFTGSIGQSANSYYLELDVNNAGDRTAVFNSRGSSIWFKGTASTVYIIGGRRNSNMVRMDGAVDDLYVLGGLVQGTVSLKDAMSLDNLWVLEAPAAVVNIGENVTSMDAIEMNSGHVVSESSATTLTINAMGGRLIVHEDSDEGAGTVNVRGAVVEYNGSGTVNNLNVYGGLFDLRQSSATSITFTNATVFGGALSDRGGLANVTYSADIIGHGGQIETDTGNIVRIV